MKKILVIQNTYYHFETAVSIYCSLLCCGFNVHFLPFTMWAKVNDKFLQKEFIGEYDLKLFEADIDYEVGFLVTAYLNKVPVIDADIASRCRRLVYICHRFGPECSFDRIITKENSLFLSPLARCIGGNFIHQSENVVHASMQNVFSPLKLCIQGNFMEGSRSGVFLRKFRRYVGRFEIMLVGSGIDNSIPYFLQPRKFQGLSEFEFYSVINGCHFILPAIAPGTRDNDYLIRRFSSSFGLAAMLGKPIFGHECFRDIYGIPGIYYNDQNLSECIDELLSIDEVQYRYLIDTSICLKSTFREHNSAVLIDVVG